MYDDTITVDKAYYNELKDKAAACEFWYQKYYSLYLRLVGLKDRIEQLLEESDIENQNKEEG